MKLFTDVTVEKRKLINTASFCNHKKTHKNRKKEKSKRSAKASARKTDIMYDTVCICTRKGNSRQNVMRVRKGRNPFLCSVLHLFALNHAKDMALCSRAEGISIIRLEGRKGKEGKERDKMKGGYTLPISPLTASATGLRKE